MIFHSSYGAWLLYSATFSFENYPSWLQIHHFIKVLHKADDVERQGLLFQVWRLDFMDFKTLPSGTVLLPGTDSDISVGAIIKQQQPQRQENEGLLMTCGFSRSKSVPFLTVTLFFQDPVVTRSLRTIYYFSKYFQTYELAWFRYQSYEVNRPNSYICSTWENEALSQRQRENLGTNRTGKHCLTWPLVGKMSTLLCTVFCFCFFQNSKRTGVAMREPWAKVECHP